MIKGAEIKGMDKVQKDFTKFLEASKKNPIILNEVGEKTVEYVKGSTRARRGDYKVDDVKEGWARRRARLAAFNTTANTYVGSKTTEVLNREIGRDGSDRMVKGFMTVNHKNTIKKSAGTKSNLTFTGEFLDSMKHKVAVTTGRVTIFFQGMHKRYRGVNGDLVGEETSNAEIAAKLNGDPRFHFLFVSKDLERILKETILRGMRRQLSNYRKVKRLLSK